VRLLLLLQISPPPSLIIFQMDPMSDLKRRAVRDIPVTLSSNLSAACPQWLISVTPQPLVLLLCGMASSSESVGMACDSITNQIYLTDARK
jgi:hypothetical protein